MSSEKRYQGSYCPKKNECLELLEEYGTPEHVKKHCIAVATVAGNIADELNKIGLKLNLPLIMSAGYLHDIARVSSGHETVGAEYLESIGLESVSEIVRYHTFHNIVNTGFDITEMDVLCIADRLVLEDKFAGAEKRMQYIKGKALKKFGPESAKEIDMYIRSFIEYIENLENFLGKHISEFVDI